MLVGTKIARFRDGLSSQFFFLFFFCFVLFFLFFAVESVWGGGGGGGAGGGGEAVNRHENSCDSVEHSIPFKLGSIFNLQFIFVLIRA